jgi:polyphosphate glucokinase
MPEPSKHSAVAPSNAATHPHTLCIDIGGTGLKALIVAADGKPLTDRARVETPRPATPPALLSAIFDLIKPLGHFDRVSVGFPGVVVDGVTRTAPNLHDDWAGFDLAKAVAKHTGRPVRALNDAGVQGYAVVEGRGVEIVVTLGTGCGFGLFHEGVYVPNLELGHHIFKKDKTYEDYLGAHGLERTGKDKWNEHVAQAIHQIEVVFNPRRIYLGGGNAKHVHVALPACCVQVVENVSGLIGGHMLWRDTPVRAELPAQAAKSSSQAS